VARHLLRKLAGDKRLTNPLLEKGPFKIGWDDLRPVNVLLNENIKIIGVVHWEFTYAVPAEFSYAPPWWLLIEKSEVWPKGIEDWTRVFGEDTAIYPGQLKEDQRLSGPMQQSWESGDFWIFYAVSHRFAFDAIYWQKIDTRFFGPTQSPKGAWKYRLGLLDEKTKDEMEQLVARKLEEMKTRILAWDQDEYTVAFRQHLKRRRGRQRKRKPTRMNGMKPTRWRTVE
jgi:hypothetical protein